MGKEKRKKCKKKRERLNQWFYVNSTPSIATIYKGGSWIYPVVKFWSEKAKKEADIKKNEG